MIVEELLPNPCTPDQRLRALRAVQQLSWASRRFRFPSDFWLRMLKRDFPSVDLGKFSLSPDQLYALLARGEALGMANVLSEAVKRGRTDWVRAVTGLSHVYLLYSEFLARPSAEWVFDLVSYAVHEQRSDVLEALQGEEAFRTYLRYVGANALLRYIVQRSREDDPRMLRPLVRSGLVQIHDLYDAASAAQEKGYVNIRAYLKQQGI